MTRSTTAEDRRITPTVFCSLEGCPVALRRIRFKTEDGNTLVFLTSSFALSPFIIA